MTVEELVATLGLNVDKEGFDKAEKAIDGVKTALLAIGAAVAAAATALGEMVRQTADAADALDKTSQAVGVSTDSLQELQYAAALSGVDAGELQVGLQQLSRMALEASQGSEQMAEAFNTAGVRFRDAHGELRPVDQLLGDLADRMQNFIPENKKAGIAMELMGRAGARMIPLLNGGRAALADMAAEFHAIGGEMSKDQIARAVKFNDTLSAVGRGFTAIRDRIGNALIPVLLPLVESMKEWFARNGELISTVVVHAVEALTSALGWLKDHADLVETVLGAVGVVLVGLGVIAMATGAQMALAWLIGMAPIIAIGAAILALGALIFLIGEDLYTFFKGGDSLAGRFSNWLWTKLPEAFAFVKAKFFEFVEWAIGKVEAFGKALWQGLKNAFFTAIDGWKQLFLGFWNWIVTSVKGLGAEVLDALKGAVMAAAQALPGGQLLVSHLFGPGASSPTGSAQNAAGSVIGGNTFQVEQHITSTHGQSAEAIGQSAADHLEEFHNRKMAEAAAAVG